MILNKVIPLLPVAVLPPGFASLRLLLLLPGGSDGKESACKGDRGSIPGSGISPEEVTGNLLQYSCLENPTDRGAWRATVHRVTELDTTEQLILGWGLTSEVSFPLMKVTEG